MTRLGAVMSQAIVHHYGRDELLRRLANPFWFQSFGSVMGMDWHSSGIATSVIASRRCGEFVAFIQVFESTQVSPWEYPTPRRMMSHRL